MAENAEPWELLNLSIQELSEIPVDTVYAASKFSQKVTDAPASVSVVTRDQSLHFGYRTLSDLVRGVRGFDVTYDREYTYTNVRGFNGFGDFGSRALLLIDGHRMNEPIYDSTGFGTDGLLDIDLVDRVEFVRGPSSAVYGNNAFFGVINVITRRGRDIHGVETAFVDGSLGTYSGRLTIGDQLSNGFEYLFSASTYSSEGQKKLYYKEFNTPKTNHSIAFDLDSDRYWSTFGKVNFGDFTVQGGYITRKKDSPTASFGAVFNTPNTDVDSRGYLELRYDHTTESGLGIAGRLHYDVYNYSSSSYNDRITSIAINHDSNQARWWGAELEVSRQLLHNLRLAWGAEIRQDDKISIYNYDVFPYVSYMNRVSEMMNFGTYIDSEWKITKELGLTSGLSWDHYDCFGDRLDPRLALIWKPLEDTTIKFLYGESFHSPNVYQLTNNSPTLLEESYLKPETIRSYEVVFEHYFNSHWKASSSIFRNELGNVINSSTLANSQFAYVNEGSATVDGASIELEGKWQNGLLLRSSFTRQEAFEVESNRWLVNSPKNVFKTQIAVPLWKEKLFGGLEVLYSSERLTLRENKTPAVWLLNFTLFSKEIAPGLDVSASIYNLLDQRYAFPSGVEHVQDSIAQDGRTFQVKFTYKF
jgi:iron complex outermembrane receptor protein